MNSLTSRLLFASVILLPIVLGFSAYILDRSFRDSLYKSKQETLSANIYALLVIAEPSLQSLVLTSQPAEPRLATPDSGFYATVVDRKKNAIWESLSLEQSPGRSRHDLQMLPIAQPGEFLFAEVNFNGQSFLSFSLGTEWPVGGEEKFFQFSVFESMDTINKPLATYRQSLWSWMGGLALLLVATQMLVMRWGLSPLKTIAGDIKAIESGKNDTLTGKYPLEISRLTHNINHLLVSEKSQRNKYQKTMADLAHSLKTPLAVVRSILESNKSALYKREDTASVGPAVDEQVQRMSDIIDHQLQRASAEIRQAFTKPIEIFPIAQRIGAALGKIYSGDSKSFDNLIATSISYAADENDLMEILGNLIENGFKYGVSKVSVSSKILRDGVEIYIEDDGPGIEKDKHHTILKRGARADTSAPGQGIGLDVVTDILSSYNGELRIEQSSLGGAKFVVHLPSK